MLLVNVYQPFFTLLVALFSPLRFVTALMKGKLSGALALSAKIGVSPPAIAVQLQLAADLAAKLKAAIAAGLKPPSISVGFNALLKLQLLLQKYTLLLGLAGNAEVSVYEGPASGLAAAVQAGAGSTLSPPLTSGSEAVAVVLLVDENDSAATGVLKTLFPFSSGSRAKLAMTAVFAPLLGPLGIFLALLTLQVAADITLLPTIAINLPSLTLMVTLMGELVIALQAALSAGITLPTITIALSAEILAVLDLELAIGLALGLLAQAKAGAQMMVYEGAIGGISAAIGPAVGSAPGSPQVAPGDTVLAVVVLVSASDTVSLSSVQTAFSIQAGT